MNAESLSWIIKRLEPRMRELGKTFSWDKVNQEILAGSDLCKLGLPDTPTEEIDAAVSKFAETCPPFLAGGSYEQNEQEIQAWGAESTPPNGKSASDKPTPSPSQTVPRKLL